VIGVMSDAQRLHADRTRGATQIRVARHTERLAEVVAFYRDGIGLPEIGAFRDHSGYDGVFLEVPETGTHLEFTSGGAHRGPVAHPDSLLVLYLGSEDAVRTVAARLRADPVAPANPYWAEKALTFEDPDGFRVVLVPEPWIPDREQATSPRDGEADAIRVELHSGPRAAIRHLFELAEDSAEALDAYIDAGRVLVAVSGDTIAGHVQITEAERANAAEVKNMAVDPSLQGRGVGRRLMAAAVDLARREGHSTLVVATAAADTGNLRFYQRLGFRLRDVERDAFTAATGYPPGLEVDGIALRDRVWLDLRLAPTAVPIRGATAAERAALERLQRRSSDVWEAYREQLAAHPDAIALPDTFIRNGWVRVAVAEDDCPIGFSVVIPGVGESHELDGLFVAPGHMRRGIGRALVEDAAMRARERGAACLEVTAGPAQGFYERVGFTVVGSTETRFAPAVRMRRDLRG
jgi:GNAT superfamily N-acetyltransferase